MVSDDRGQAYALEGFIAAVVLLVAVLIAVQSVVVSPSAGGSVDRSVQAQLQGEVQNALVVAEAEGDLSHVIRYWDPNEDDYYNASPEDVTIAHYTADQFGNRSTMSEATADEFAFGELLDERFGQSGRAYNVEVVYQNHTAGGDVGTESFFLVYQGSPDSNAMSASHMVTLTDDQRLTAPETTETLREAGNESNDGSYPIPNVDEDGQVYNVVEVRLVVW